MNWYKNMNWYKKGQLIMDNLDLGWSRFTKYYGTPWKNILVLDIGNPTKEEKRKIQKLKLYNNIISPETIRVLEQEEKNKGFL